MFILGSCQSGKKDATNSTADKDAPIAEDIINLTQHGIANNPNNVLGGLKEGDIAPDFELEDQDGN